MLFYDPTYRDELYQDSLSGSTGRDRSRKTLKFVVQAAVLVMATSAAFCMTAPGAQADDYNKTFHVSGFSQDKMQTTIGEDVGVDEYYKLLSIIRSGKEPDWSEEFKADTGHIVEKRKNARKETPEEWATRLSEEMPLVVED